MLTETNENNLIEEPIDISKFTYDHKDIKKKLEALISYLEDDKMLVRRFEENDATEVSSLIGRNFVEINSKDYPLEEMREKALLFSLEKIKGRASKGHTYVQRMLCREK